jgi:hypothetical protein
LYALVEKGMIKALINALKSKDSKIVIVALEGLSNIFKAGQTYFNLVLIYLGKLTTIV